MTPKRLFNDLVRSRELLEDIVGETVLGYRAPSFAVDDAVLEVIREAGYRYDSSYNSFGMHGRYGRISLDSQQCHYSACITQSDFVELPVSNLAAGSTILPWAGGGYFRLFPAAIFLKGVRAVVKKTNAYIFYMHPWEIDPDQPRVQEAARWFKFRHYINLHHTEAKLRRLITAFEHCRFATCRNYLLDINKGGLIPAAS
jgi:polysaccharide deacetylase family protein (PEP-CTERM system associated)